MNRRGFLASLFALPFFRWPRKSKQLLGSVAQAIRSAKAHGIELPVEVSNGAGDRIYVVQKWEGIPLERRMTVL